MIWRGVRKPTEGEYVQENDEWADLGEWARLAATLKFINGYAARDVVQLVRLPWAAFHRA
ncbi:hypothetical protein GCM10022233_56730 [Streptomyces shaanxiensis]|uniref:Uncharacterized protein n=1 Tax=Streptomyces shaanxiensis TaxID=653357 RepID=A0ABP7VR56_9ACTN